MNFLDSHCHLNDEAYKDDLDVVLNNMVENKVAEALIISNYLSDYYRGLKIVKEGINFKHSLGVFPSDAAKISEEEFLKYEEIFKDENCIAIGEIGLDYHYGKQDHEAQKEIFIRQIEIAKQLNKPIIVHSREAIQDTYDILKEHVTRGVLHCYSDSKEMAKEFVKLGYYISISGTITFKNAVHPLQVVESIPLDRLLIETDCPYLSPVPNRGKRNEPAYVIYTAKKICELLKMDLECFLDQINKNYHCLFDKIN